MTGLRRTGRAPFSTNSGSAVTIKNLSVQNNDKAEATLIYLASPSIGIEESEVYKIEKKGLIKYKTNLPRITLKEAKG